MEILLKRLQQKARSRKKHLFAKYSELINSFETAQNIIETIHEELGQENFVTVSDILLPKAFCKTKNREAC